MLAPLRRRAFRLPDTSAPGFAEEARRQAQRIAASMRAGDDLAFAEAAQY